MQLSCFLAQPNIHPSVNNGKIVCGIAIFLHCYFSANKELTAVPLHMPTHYPKSFSNEIGISIDICSVHTTFMLYENTLDFLDHGFVFTSCLYSPRFCIHSELVDYMNMFINITSCFTSIPPLNVSFVFKGEVCIFNIHTYKRHYYNACVYYSAPIGILFNAEQLLVPFLTSSFSLGLIFWSFWPSTNILKT